jgi:fatty acid desaturase
MRFDAHLQTRTYAICLAVAAAAAAAVVVVVVVAAAAAVADAVVVVVVVVVVVAVVVGIETFSVNLFPYFSLSGLEAERWREAARGASPSTDL